MAYLQDEKPAEGPYHWPSREEASVIGKDHHRLDGWEWRRYV